MTTINTITIGKQGASVIREEPPKPEKPVAPAPADEKKPTEAEIEQRRKEVAIAMGWEKPEAKKEETKPEVKPEAKPETKPEAAKPEVKPETKPETKPAKPAKREEPEGEREERLITRTARETATAVAEALKPKEEPKPEVKTPELWDDDRKDLEVFQKMEEMNPKKKGIADKFKEFCLRRYDYETKWQAKNPGKDFDPESPEHEELFSTQPAFDPEEFDEAKLEVRLSKRLQEHEERVLGPIKEREKAQEREELLAKAKPGIVQQAQNRTIALVAAVDPTLADLLKDDKGNINLGEANVKQLEEKDPLAADILRPMVFGELIPMVFELQKLLVPDLKYTLDPQKNPVHAQIARFTHEFEQTLLDGPADVRTDDQGRTFITVARHQELMDDASKIRDASARQRAINDIDKQHFTVTIADLEDYIADDISARAQQKYQHLDRIGRAKYERSAPKDGSQPAAAKPEETPAPTPARRRPPSLANGSETQTVAAGAAGGGKNFGATMADVMFGK